MSEFLMGLPPDMLLAHVRERQEQFRAQSDRARLAAARPERPRAAIARVVRRLRLAGRQA